MTKRIVLPGLLVPAFAASTAQTIVIAAIPGIARDFGVTGTTATWALTSFMLASAVATPIAGRLGDLFGYRRILLACLGFFTVGTVLCATAGSFPMLLAGRALAGVSGGVFPLAFGVIRQAVPPERRPGVIAVLSAMFGIGGAAGMVVAGPLLDGFGTAWLFWPLLALAVVAFALAWALPADGATRGGRIDLAGAALLGGALVCLLLGISEVNSWGATALLGLFLGAAALFAAFGVIELRVREPLVDLRLLGRRAMAMTNLVTVVIGAAMFGVVTLIPRLVQTFPGASATEAGLVLIPMAVVMLVVTPFTPRLRERFGARAPLQAGALCAIVSFAVLAFVHDRLWQVSAVNVLVGAGYGLAFAALGNLVMDAVEPGHTGVATGVNTIARTAGGAVGAQLAAALVTGSEYTLAFVVFALVAAAALAMTSAIPLRARPLESVR